MLKKVSDLIANKEYDEAISLMEKHGSTKYPHFLVKKGICHLLRLNGDEKDLIVAKKSFKKAISIDNKHIPSIIELGWFLYSIEDNALESKKLFNKSLDISKEYIVESLEGLLKSVKELSSKEEALELSKKVLVDLTKSIKEIEVSL